MTDETVTHEPHSLRVLWRDDALIAVDKPAGQLSVPGRGVDKADCTWSHVRALWPDALVVHRLDQATSGLMLFARGLHMQRVLSRAFAERAIEKRYTAVAHGLLTDDTGRVELPLAADWPQRPRQRIDHAAGKPARTDWHVLLRDVAHRRTRLLLQPVTGRTHQLRVHMAAIGHPIVGDALYTTALDATGPRLLLHASELQLTHPLDASPLLLQSQAPF
jgi:tRNA pseudouridine32 synthase / 23S rRNA pseudouridine746 synthase